MALANHLSLPIYSTREHVDLGRKFLRFAVISLMWIGVLAPVVRVTSDFWIKLDQLLLPGVLLVYLFLLLAGLARPIRPNWLFAVGLAFCICIAMSLVYGTQIIGHALLFRDLFDLFKPALPVLFFTLAFEADLTEESLRTLQRTMVPTVLAICLYAYGQWFNLGLTAYLQPYYSGGLHDDGGLAHYRRVYATLSNPNFLGMLMTWVIAAFALAAWLRVGSRFWNLAAMVAALITLTMTGSRYGLLDTALAVALIFVLPTATQIARKKRTAALLTLLPLVLGTITLISVSNKATLDRFQQLRTPLRENSLRMRLDGLWRDAAGQFLESPLLGHGPAKIIFSNVYTDSEYLQILKQYGLLGLVPYLCLFLVPLAMIWKGLRCVPRFGPTLEREFPATYWALCVSFVVTVTSLFMNVGMGTYYNLSLLAFLWMWMGIGASAAKRISENVGLPKQLLQSGNRR